MSLNHGSECLVLGYGVCARILADKLRGLSANVTVCARAATARAQAASMGYRVTDFDGLNNRLRNSEFIFNTVPAKVLTERQLIQIPYDAIIIDIASAPGGIDWAAATRLERKALHCLGLPGHYAPKSSATYLADIILLNI